MAKKGVIGNLTAPFGHIATATGETISEVASTAGNVAKRVINGARKVGSTWVTHTDEVLKSMPPVRKNTKNMNNTKKKKRKSRGKKTRNSKN